MNEVLEITTLTGKECLTTRSLWEQVFCEDSKKFLDYYYTWKAEDNIGYVIGKEPYKAMMFRTPYEIQIGDRKRSLSYLVAVATGKEFRHKGYMTALLQKAFACMYREKNPFTYLMPADPAIYQPFDFSFIYERQLWTLDREWIEALEDLWGKENGAAEEELQAAEYTGSCPELVRQWEEKTGYCLRSLRQGYGEEEKSEIVKKMADFANSWLAEKYEIYAVRSEEYYLRQLQELISQNGDIFIAEKNGEIQGILLYGREEEDLNLQEVMENREGLFSFLEIQKEKEPVIMARIIHLEEMLKLVRSRERKTLLLEVEDPLLPQNDGIYRVEMTPEGSTVTKLKENRETEKFYHIGDLAPQLLKNVFLNEIV